MVRGICEEGVCYHCQSCYPIYQIGAARLCLYVISAVPGGRDMECQTSDDAATCIKEPRAVLLSQENPADFFFFLVVFSSPLSIEIF
jgi:hypothetical protein